MTIQLTIDVHTFRWLAQQNQPVLDGTCIFCFILPGPTNFRWILYYISELHPLVIHGKFSLAKEHPACWKRKVICQDMVFQSHIIFDSRRVLHGTPPFPATRQANQPTWCHMDWWWVVWLLVEGWKWSGHKYEQVGRSCDVGLKKHTCCFLYSSAFCFANNRHFCGSLGTQNWDGLTPN